jgi:hypothetical protein
VRERRAARDPPRAPVAAATTTERHAAASDASSSSDDDDDDDDNVGRRVRFDGDASDIVNSLKANAAAMAAMVAEVTATAIARAEGGGGARVVNYSSSSSEEEDDDDDDDDAQLCAVPSGLRAYSPLASPRRRLKPTAATWSPTRKGSVHTAQQRQHAAGTKPKSKTVEAQPLDDDDAVLEELRSLRARLRRDPNPNGPSPGSSAASRSRGARVSSALRDVEDAAATRIQARYRGGVERAALPMFEKAVRHASRAAARRLRRAARLAIAAWASLARARRRLRSKARACVIKHGKWAHHHLGGSVGRAGEAAAWRARDDDGVAGVADAFRDWRHAAWSFTRWREWAAFEAPVVNAREGSDAAACLSVSVSGELVRKSVGDGTIEVVAGGGAIGGGGGIGGRGGRRRAELSSSSSSSSSESEEEREVVGRARAWRTAREDSDSDSDW